MGEADFWNNQEAAQKLVLELKGVKAVVESYKTLHQELEDEIGLLEMCDELKDAEHLKQVEAKIPEYTRRVEATEVKALLDRKSVV